MSLNTESKYPSRRAYVVKMRSDAKPGELAGRVENLVTGASREFASGRELLESIASDLEANAEGRAMSDARRIRSIGALWAEDLEEVDREIVRLATPVPGEGPPARRELRRVLQNDASVCANVANRRSSSASCTTCSCCTWRYARKRSSSFGQAQTAAIEDYVIERLRKSFPDLPGGWPPA